MLTTNDGQKAITITHLEHYVLWWAKKKDELSNFPFVEEKADVKFIIINYISCIVYLNWIYVVTNIHSHNLIT